MSEKTIRERLFELRDEKYKDFQCKLIPGVSPENVIGVRTPVLRSFAKKLMKDEQQTAWDFLGSLPHSSYDENNLHGFLIELIRDYDETIKALDVFLPYVDNWATCDLMSPKVFRKNKDRLLSKIDKWLADEKTYTVRFAIEMLMSFYLDEETSADYSERVCAVKGEDYYIRMMVAWYFATALAKHYDETLPYIENRRLAPWTHNKTISKACESYRISDEQKVYIKTLKINKCR